MIRGIRGATTIKSDSAEEIISRTEALVREMVRVNNLDPSDIASMYISVTDDITAEFPAKALRNIENFTFVPVMCMKEINVPGSLRHCIRVMMNVNTSLSQTEVEHIYQEGAIILRPDLRLTKDDEL
ncbi:chorismate mutase [Bacillus salitolerans]|uniref:chorismate mutase n=1 Tax=Bacillus salitolerans TaxID=1437434 RepID=A0ABW4LWL9_9BACI